MNQEVKVGFWKLQFSEETTPGRNQFDVFFGIIAPILCLIFDPGVFRGGFIGGSGYMSDIKLFAYLSIGLGITVLTIWLSLKLTSRILISAISGIFFAEALLALTIGIVLLPMSLLGLMFLSDLHHS